MNDLITIEDLVSRIGQEELAQVAGIGSFNSPEGRSLDESRINEQIDFANELITSHLAKRYPFYRTLARADAPEILRGYGADIVRYRLRHRSGDRNTVSEEVRQRYEDAVKWLEKVARGLVNIDFGEDRDSPASTTTPSGSVNGIIPPAAAGRVLEGY